MQSQRKGRKGGKGAGRAVWKSRVPEEQGAHPQDGNPGPGPMLSEYINNFANHFR